MAIKVFWVKLVKTSLEVVSIIYFIVGAFIFLAGLYGFLWAVVPSTSLKAGSYMIASFFAIGTALLGFIGAYADNFCMLMAYGIIMTVIFAMRTISTMILLKITANPYDTQIPAIMQGFPGTSASVGHELVFAIIEILLAMCAFYQCYAIHKRNALNYFDPQYYYTISDYEGLHSNLSLVYT